MPPQRMSSPLRPRILSLPPKPWITSALGVPLKTLLRSLPLIVGDLPKQRRTFECATGMIPAISTPTASAKKNERVRFIASPSVPVSHDVILLKCRGKGCRAGVFALCACCPVRQECLDYALEVEGDNGIWGGKQPREPLGVASETGLLGVGRRVP